MSKERYELRYVGDWHCYVYDNEKKQGAELCSLDDSVRVFNEQDKTIKDLEAKLAEKEQEINDICQNYDFQINDFSREVHRLQKREKILEQQLAEKEEINKLVNEQLKDMEKSKLSWENQYFTLYKTLKNYREVVEKKDQDKISFCIEKLEKLKNEITPIFCVPNGIYSNLHNEVFKTIDNQIKLLKEGKSQ